MIQRYGYLSLQVNYLNSFVQNHAYCQKIFSTPHFLAFSIRRPGESIWFYLGRGGEYQGIWVSKSAPSPEIRVQDTFLSYVRKHLLSTWLSIEIDPYDRIICIHTTYFGKAQKFLYFWSGADSYFIHTFSQENKNDYSVLKSWNFKFPSIMDTCPKTDLLFSYFDEVGRKNLPDKSLPTLDNLQSVAEHQIERYLSKQIFLPENSKDKRKIQKKLENIKRDLEKLSQFNILKSYLDSFPQEIPVLLTFGDLKIKFPENSTIEQRRNLAYSKLKFWKKHYSLMSDRLKNEESNLSSLKPSPKIDKIIKPVWKIKPTNQAIPIEPISTNSQFEFYFIKDFNIHLAIGLNAHGNDMLRKEWANKSDYWFHLIDDTSPHVFIKFVSTPVFDQRLFNIIGSLIVRKKKSNFLGGQIIYCLTKDLRSVKGKPGSVIYKNVKKVQFWLDQNLDSVIEKINGRLRRP